MWDTVWTSNTSLVSHLKANSEEDCEDKVNWRFCKYKGILVKEEVGAGCTWCECMTGGAWGSPCSRAGVAHTIHWFCWPVSVSVRKGIWHYFVFFFWLLCTYFYKSNLIYYKTRQGTGDWLILFYSWMVAFQLTHMKLLRERKAGGEGRRRKRKGQKFQSWRCKSDTEVYLPGRNSPV